MNEIAKIAAANAHSLIEWWKMAGADYLVKEAPQSWLIEDEPELAVAPPMVAQPERPAVQEFTAQVAHVPSEASPSDWPQDLEQLKAQIAAGAHLPGNGFGGKSAAPIGNAGASLMIISDLPSAEEIEQSRLSGGNTGRLLEQMLAAMGQKLDDCYVTALATTRPAIGEIPEGAEPALAAFMTHQMKIVKPKAVLILGTAACQALLNAELMTARQNLHYFNHDGQKVTALTTFHPRTLLARPILKAQAWKDLQMLMIKGVL
jgi:uracil-DNA glycosylase